MNMKLNLTPFIDAVKIASKCQKLVYEYTIKIVYKFINKIEMLYLLSNCILSCAHIFATIFFLDIGNIYMAYDIVVNGYILTNQKSRVVRNLYFRICK